MKPKHIYLFRVPANDEGEEFIKQFKQALNSDSYKIRRMYSGKRPKGTSQYSTRKENADSIRVYLEGKASQKDYWYDEVLERWVSKTTSREAIKQLEHVQDVLRCLV